MSTSARSGYPYDSATVEPTTGPTRALLVCGVIAGPLYVLVTVIEGLTRAGFEFTRHAASILANGDLGWIHVVNLILTGALTMAAAVGLRRAFTGQSGGRWGPRLIGVYGASLIGAGVFRADPTHGFPVGTPEGPGPVSWHGLLHLTIGALGFVALIAATFVIARGQSRRGERGWAVYSRVTGVVFLLGFIGIASGPGASPATVIGFWVAVILAWVWLSALSGRLYRRTVAPLQR